MELATPTVIEQSGSNGPAKRHMTISFEAACNAMMESSEKRAMPGRASTTSERILSVDHQVLVRHVVLKLFFPLFELECCPIVLRLQDFMLTCR